MLKPTDSFVRYGAVVGGQEYGRQSVETRGRLIFSLDLEVRRALHGIKRPDSDISSSSERNEFRSTAHSRRDRLIRVPL